MSTVDRFLQEMDLLSNGLDDEGELRRYFQVIPPIDWERGHLVTACKLLEEHEQYGFPNAFHKLVSIALLLVLYDDVWK